MSNKSFCNRKRQRQRTRPRAASVAATLFTMACVWLGPQAAAGDAPAWMHALVSVPLPAHDEKTDAALLYSEDVLNVQSNGKIKRLQRRAYKILRPDGRRFGTVRAHFDSDTKINSIHAWCVPAQGKDYPINDKDPL